jgi:hypothetical protein
MKKTSVADPHHFRKPDPDPHQSKKPRALEAHNGTTEAHPGTVEAHSGAVGRLTLEPWRVCKPVKFDPDPAF